MMSIYRNEDIHDGNITKKLLWDELYSLGEIKEYCNVATYKTGGTTELYLVTTDSKFNYGEAYLLQPLSTLFTKNHDDNYVFGYATSWYGFLTARTWEINPDSETGNKVTTHSRYYYDYLYSQYAKSYDNIKFVQKDYTPADIYKKDYTDNDIPSFQKEFVETDNIIEYIPYSESTEFFARSSLYDYNYNVFLLTPESIQFSAEQKQTDFNISRNTTIISILYRRYFLGYPYRGEFIDDGGVLDFVPLWAYYPVPKKESNYSYNFFLPLYLPWFFSFSLVSILAGMAYITTLDVSTNVALQSTYDTYYYSSHCNVYTYDRANFTKAVFSWMQINGVTDAPGGILHVVFIEPDVGLYHVSFRQEDENTKQMLTSYNWYTSDYPIDMVQQQFPEHYLQFEYPVYVRLQFDLSQYPLKNYDLPVYQRVVPQTKDALITTIGFCNFEITNINDSSNIDIPISNNDTDNEIVHYGIEPINGHVLTTDEFASVPIVTKTEVNKFLHFISSNDVAYTEQIKKGEIPFGLIRGNTLTSAIRDKLNELLNDKEHKDDSYVEYSGIISLKYLYIAIDGEVVTVDGDPLWKLVGSMFQPTKMYAGMLRYYNEPSYNIYRTRLIAYLYDTLIPYIYRFINVYYYVNAFADRNGNWRISYNFRGYNVIKEHIEQSYFCYPAFYYDEDTNKWITYSSSNLIVYDENQDTIKQFQTNSPLYHITPFDTFIKLECYRQFVNIDENESIFS